MEGSIKSQLSIISSSVFLRNGLLLPSNILHDDRVLEYMKADRTLFLKRIHFCAKLGKIGPK